MIKLKRTDSGYSTLDNRFKITNTYAPTNRSGILNDSADKRWLVQDLSGQKPFNCSMFNRKKPQNRYYTLSDAKAALAKIYEH